MQSPQCNKEIYADKGADPALINVTTSLYPNCNGLWIRLEDSILATICKLLTPCARDSNAESLLPAGRVGSLLHAAPLQGECVMPLGVTFRGAKATGS